MASKSKVNFDYSSDEAIFKAVRRITWFPIILMTFLALGATSFSTSFSRYDETQSFRRMIMDELKSQNVLIVNEIYLHQRAALELRLKLIIQSIRERIPKGRFCLNIDVTLRDDWMGSNVSACSKELETSLDPDFIENMSLELAENKIGSVQVKGLMVYDFWDFLPRSLMISILLALLGGLTLERILFYRLKTKAIVPLLEKIRSDASAASLTSMASQVAHDIRSPLAALQMLVKDLNQIPEDRRVLLRQAMTRISDIANNLLRKNKASLQRPLLKAEKSNTGTVRNEMLSSLLENIVSEKRLQYRSKIGVEIIYHSNPGSYGVFGRVEASDFSRMMSNLINNSVEALIDDCGFIQISLSQNDKYAVIEISDNGRGIPQKIMDQLGQSGMSYGKDKGIQGQESGNGLGLYHAKSMLAQWGGLIQIQSIEFKGTKIFIYIPKPEQNPKWFLNGLAFNSQSRVVMVDDDSTIHQIWMSRFKLQNELKDIKCLHLSTPEIFENWIELNKANLSKTHFLIDFEFLGSDLNGLELIQKWNLHSRSVLVTSRFDEIEIRDRCEEIGVKILAKNLVGIVPVIYEG